MFTVPNGVRWCVSFTAMVPAGPPGMKEDRPFRICADREDERWGNWRLQSARTWNKGDAVLFVGRHRHVVIVIVVIVIVYRVHVPADKQGGAA